MGPYQSLPLTANIRKNSTSAKTLTIIVPGKKLRIKVADPSLPISKLLTLINHQYPSRYPIISLKTIDSQETLDYWLSFPDKDLSPLSSETQLIAIFYSPTPRKISCNAFEILKVLGKGSYSLVTLVRKRDTGRMYAMKSIEKQRALKELSVQQILTEKRILSSIDHPFICKMFWAFQSNKKLHIIMEYYPGGELFFHLRRVGRFSEEHARFYFAEVLMSLKYLHEKDIAYRDLKPENIVIDIDGHIRLTDFGLSKMDMRGESQSFCGSPEYMSPEMLNNQSHTKIVDLYCLGVLLYELLTGHPPFYDRDRNQMYLKILNSRLEFPNFLSSAAKDLLTKLLERNPNKRIGSENGIEEVMQHVWCQDLHFGRLMEKKIEPPFVPDLESSNIGEKYSKIKTNLEFFSDSEPASDDQFQDFEFNSVQESDSLRNIFEQTSRTHVFNGLRSLRNSEIGLEERMMKQSSFFTHSPMISPSLSINLSGETLSDSKVRKSMMP